MTPAQTPHTLTANGARVREIRQAIATLTGHAESLTLWVSGDRFADWAYALCANVMHTMRRDTSTFAWCTSDASNLETRVVVHTHDSPGPWVQYPPHGSEDTKRYKLFIELERD